MQQPQVRNVPLTEKEVRCIQMELENCKVTQKPPYPFLSKPYEFFVENVEKFYWAGMDTAEHEAGKCIIKVPAGIDTCIQKLKEASLENWEANLDENFVNEDEIEGGDIDTSDFEGKDDSSL